jgi:hypothetical protein
MSRKAIPSDALMDLRRRLAPFSPRSAERRQIMQDTATLYGVSETTLYRALRERARPRVLHRADQGSPRVVPTDEMQRYCEVIAAIKLRTSNKQGRHLSTAEAIRVLEAFGIETPDGHIRAPQGWLKKPTVNRYLKHWGYDRATLLRPPPAVRFQADYSNECWHFDLSPSDLKQVKSPVWFQEGRGHPLLMLYSVVDDRSGVAYQPMVLVSSKPIVLVDCIARVMHLLQAGKACETLPCMEAPMTTLDCITALFYEVDEPMRAIPKHPEARLWPSEVVTLGLLHARKGVGNRAFYRWLTRDSRALFPRVPKRTRLFRLFRTHQDWTQIFLAAPTVLGVIDTYGIELIHPMREGRSPQQIGRKGLSNHR